MAEGKQVRRGQLEKAGDILPEFIRQMAWGKEFQQNMVMYRWPEIVGKDIAAHAKPVKMEFKRLFLYTPHPAWAEQLKYMAGALIRKLNRELGGQLVQEIVFTGYPGFREESPRGELGRKSEENLAQEVKKIKLPEAELQRIDSSCQAISDEEMREKFRLWRRHMARLRQYRLQQGWHACAGEGCVDLCPGEAELCPACLRKRRQAKENKMQQLFWDMPWARYGDMSREIECSQGEFDSQRQIFLQQLASKVAYGDSKSLEAKMLVMAWRSIGPDQLNDEVIKKTLHKLRFDVRYVKLKKDKKAKEKDEKGKKP